MTGYRPTYAEIDLAAVRTNVEALGALIGADTQRLAVVKANAYGHGDVEVARACIDAGATWLGVALVEEGIKLRDAGLDVPILVLVEATPEAAKVIVDHDLRPSIFTFASAEALSEAATLASKTLKVHVCVDTGMHREGAPLEEGADLVERTAALPRIEVEGLWSHFAVADEERNPFTHTQIERFTDLCESVARRGIDVPVRHLANSAGLMAHADAHFDLVRMGIALYGLYPTELFRPICALRPAMKLASAVTSTRRVPAGDGISYGLTYAPARDVVIANIPIGYGDGFARLLSNNAHVLVGGARRPLAGRVTMDTIMVDCGSDEPSVGDEAVLIGPQGDDEITADEIAAKIGTINYEVVCSVSPRVPRTYVG